jgi:cytochrome b561
MASRPLSMAAEVPGQQHYALGLRLLHWLTVLLVIAQVIVIWSIPEGDTGQSPLWGVHGTLGPLILVVTLVRLVVRWSTHVPDLPPDVPTWQRRVARLNQAALYLVLIAMPLTGWAIFSVHGNGPLMFGVLQLPPIVNPAPEGVKPEDVAAPYATAHVVLGWVLLVLVGLHVLGALYHALLRRDGVFSSMASLSR